MQRVGLALPYPTRGLAVDGDEVGLRLTQAVHPGREAFGKAACGQRIHLVVQGIVGRNAMGKRP
jgi:hypothetical protein